jgi:hypothetical protein
LIAARAALAAYNAEAEQDEPGDELTAPFDRERLALECVAATRARAPLGISEKALLVEACAESTETVMSLCCLWTTPWRWLGQWPAAAERESLGHPLERELAATRQVFRHKRTCTRAQPLLTSPRFRGPWRPSGVFLEPDRNLPGIST